MKILRILILIMALGATLNSYAQCPPLCYYQVVDTAEYCTLTQGFYGNAGGKYCDGTGTLDLLNLLLTDSLVIGGPNNAVVFTPGDAQCVIDRLPGGGPSAALSSSGTCPSPSGVDLHKNGRFKNALFAQTLTLGLNLRLDTALAGLEILGSPINTVQSSGCKDSASAPVAGTFEQFDVPLSVLDYLCDSNTVDDIFALANAALDGAYTPANPGDPSLDEIQEAVNALNEAFDECRWLVGFGDFIPELHCSMTQGYYGNSGGLYCDSMTTFDLLDLLLTDSLTLGGGANTILFTPNDETCVLDRLPGGGPNAALNGNATCPSPTGIQLHLDGRFMNSLLVQTLTLGLNLRLGTSLDTVEITAPYIITAASTSCDDSTAFIVAGTEESFYVPEIVLAYFGDTATVAEIYDLANQALAGAYAPADSTEPSWGDIVQALEAVNEAFDECRWLLGFCEEDPFAVNNNAASQLRLGADAVASKATADINVYPNPFNDKIYIELNLNEESEVVVEIFNIEGMRVAILFNEKAVAGQKYMLSFDASELTYGFYLYRVQTQTAVYTGKAVKTR